MDRDKHQTQPEASMSGSAADTASSLRAAALLSRKRRKVASEVPASLPPRPATELSLQLDYGQDETPTTTPTPTVPTETKPVSELQVERQSVASNQMEDIEDGQIREEGEISDTEASPPPPPQRRTPPQPLRARQPSSTAQLSKPEAGKSEVVPPAQPPPLLDPVEISPSTSSTARLRQGNTGQSEPFVLETATYRLDANHVRPGLAMTQEQYNTAKDVVLDLLGWGVPPEYLIDCSLGRHVVYYVFSELNLRLPDNLDVHGLIPYPTPEMLAMLPVSPSLSSRSLLSSSAMPPPSTIPVRGSVGLAEPLDTDHTDIDIPSPDRSPYVKAEPNSPRVSDMSSPHSLLMIEQQRRQELLARKAVIASRKARQNEPAESTNDSSDQDADRSSIPSQSVDDFLKSIEPTPGDDHSRRFISPEHMDVDEPVSGFVGTAGESVALSMGTSSAQSVTSTVILPTEPNSPANLPPGSSNTSSRDGPSISTMSSDVAGSFSPTSYIHSSFGSDGAQRRGTKRPVAADFVDFDSAAGPSRGYGGYISNGYTNGGNHLLRRKTGSFAGVSGVRRCVIELSDSEEDGDNQAVGEYLRHVDGREYSPAVTGPMRQGVATPSIPSSSGFASHLAGQPGLPTSTSTAGNGTTSPAALLEKEQEIKKMRQLIAQREELRLKKLAAMSGKSTPVVPAIPELRASAAPEKQDDSVPASSGNNERSSNVEIDHSSRNGTGESISTYDLPVTGTSTITQQITNALATGSNTYDPAGGFPTLDKSSIGHETPAQNGDLDDEHELIVTGETSSAQAVPPLTVEQHHSSAAAGDPGASSSAQVAQYPNPQSQDDVLPCEPTGFNFSVYDSPLAAHPALRSRLRPGRGGSDSSSLAAAQPLSELTIASHAISSPSTPNLHSSSSPISITSRPSCSISSHSSTPISFPDVKALKQAILSRTLGQLTARDASLRVCQYEVPGGGVCRDADCDELHLSRISSEPSDAEVAAYVHDHLPEPWCRRCDVHAISIALEGVRLRGGVKDADARVREALAGLGIPLG